MPLPWKSRSVAKQVRLDRGIRRFSLHAGRECNRPNWLTLESLEQRTLLSGTRSGSDDRADQSGHLPIDTGSDQTAAILADISDPDIQRITPLAIRGTTGDKPQSKVWQHDDHWWSVLATTGGTSVFRLDGKSWTQVLRLSTALYRADVKEVGNVAHILLYNGPLAKLASVEYVQGTTGSPGMYQFWSSRPTLADIRLTTGVEVATIDTDCNRRMWLASDGSRTIEARFSDEPYTTWSPPIVLANNVTADDISAVTSFPNCKVGVMWSNQTTDRFGFRTYMTGTDVNLWSTDELPASQSAVRFGGGMSDDHINFAVASDNTLYAAVKTSYNSLALPEIALLVRRPNGIWDRLYEVDRQGTRPIVLLNEEQDSLLVIYTNTDFSSDIVYRQSSTSTIQFGLSETLIAGTVNNASSMKENFTNEVVVIASSRGFAEGAIVTIGDSPPPPPPPTDENQPPTVDAGLEQNINFPAQAMLNGTVTDDGRTLTLSTLWSVVDGPGTVTFADSSLVDTTASFSAPGTYRLRLTADDAEFQPSDDVVINVTRITGIQTNSFQNGVLPTPGYAGTDDTYMAILIPGANFGSSVTLTADGFPDAGMLLRWNLSSIPQGSQVSAALITLNVTNRAAENYEVYQAKKNWVESQTTWSFAATGTPWNQGGAQSSIDRGSTVLGTVVTPNVGQVTITLNANGIALVQSWVNNTAVNFGFVVQDYTAAVDDLIVSSSEATTLTQRPKLTVTYDVGDGLGGPLAAATESRDGADSEHDNVPARTENQTGGSGPTAILAAGSQTIDPLTQLTVSADTGEKPQSKVWRHDNKWWSVLPNSSGTYVWRLDGTTWTSVLKLSNMTASHADAKVVGNVTHVLLYNGTSSKLASIEYVPGSPGTYQLWSGRPSPNEVAVPMSSGVETATIDVDCNGRMWMASDSAKDIEVRYTDSPYSIWSAPIKLATNTSSDDISAITSMPNCKVGVMWSNQNTDRFGFRLHTDDTDPLLWSVDEVPASQSALNVGSGMADDHINIAVASDTTLYAAVKTSYGSASGLVKIGLLIRRPNGTWDSMYEVDKDGTRPIVLLNEAESRVLVVYTGSGIVYKETSTSTIAFSAQKALISGSYNNASSTKQNFTNELVVIGSSSSKAVGALLKTGEAQNQGPLVNAGSDQSIVIGSSANLNGTISDDGLPTPVNLTSLWTMQSGPGIVSFANDADVDTTATISDIGTYVLRLTANDGALSTFDEATVNVTAVPTNQAPLVDAGANQTVVLSGSASLNGTVTDDHLPNPPDLVTTIWTMESGPGIVSFGDASQVDTTASFTATGTYVLKLTANDSVLESSDLVTVTVQEASTIVTTAFQDGVFPSTNYTGTLDTRISSGTPTANAGTSIELRVDGSPDDSTLVRWDVSSIAAGSVVQSASITLNATNRTNDVYELYELKRDWIETAATWNVAMVGTNWGQAGAQAASDRGTTVLGTVTAPALGLVTIHLNAAGMAVVQSWINNPNLNFGLIFQDYVSAGDGGSFSSRETSTTTLRPKLTVTYAAAGGSGSIIALVDSRDTGSNNGKHTIATNGDRKTVAQHSRRLETGHSRLPGKHFPSRAADSIDSIFDEAMYSELLKFESDVISPQLPHTGDGVTNSEQRGRRSDFELDGLELDWIRAMYREAGSDEL